MQGENIAVMNPHIALLFAHDNLASTQTDKDLFAMLGGIDWVAPADGYIVSAGWGLSASHVSGVLTLDLRLEGVDQAIDTVITPGDTAGVIQYEPYAYKFSAGEKIGMSYSSATLGATTCELTVVLLVLLTGVKV